MCWYPPKRISDNHTALSHAASMSQRDMSSTALALTTHSKSQAKTPAHVNHAKLI